MKYSLIKKFVVSNKSRWPLAAITCLATIVICFAVILSLQKFAHNSIQSTIKNLSLRLNAPIRIDSQDISLSKVDFHGIQIGHQSDIVFKKISVEPKLIGSLFGSNKIKSITLTGGHTKIPLDDIVAKLTQLSVKPAVDATQEQENKKTIYSRLPDIIHLQNLNFCARDVAGKCSLSVNNASGRFDRADHSAEFTAQSIDIIGKIHLKKANFLITITPYTHDLNIRIRQLVDDEKPSPWHLSFKTDRAFRRIHYKLRTNAFFIAAFPKIAQYFPDANRTTTQIKGTITRSPDRWRMTTRTILNSIKLHHPKLAKNTTDPFSLAVSFQSTYERKQHLLKWYNGKITVKNNGTTQDPPIAFHGRIYPEHDGNHKLQSYVEIKNTDCNQLLSLAPKSTLPKVANFKASGQFSFGMGFTVRLKELEKFKYKKKFGSFDCYFTPKSEAYSFRKLAPSLPLISEFQKNSGFNPGDYQKHFSPIKFAPKHLIDAFLISEDIRFYRHRGFDFETFEQALRRNLSEEKFALGASTISMQTAKNLFLSSERTFARKIQEALLTAHLENILSKNRILEIYLNIAEFGPGIYGIGAAAEHFFNKKAHQLSTLESVYLASLLPSPKTRYRHFCKRKPGRAFRELMNKKLEQMNHFGRISAESYETALHQPIKFAQHTADNTQFCQLTAHSAGPDGSSSSKM